MPELKRSTSPGREAPPGRVTGTTREDILQAAIVAFSRNGYRGTNLQDVAGELGVTRQAIYYHYRDKHAILLAMFESFFDRLSDAVATAREAESDPTLKFDRILVAHLVTVAAAPELSAVFTRDYKNLSPEARSAIHKRRRMYQKVFVADFEVAQAAGRFRTELPAHTTVSLMLGAANWTFRWYDPAFARQTPEELAALALDLFRRGLDA
ncbi:TetR family transcriptional regulator [Nocardioides sp. LHD-245]|uniref:TetR family transcriptional regulator n=1 Tax=Nocardioides sp. LHD-245 TaxID=3051387 RepID=UPI0027DFED39|nr:TetR family transcriptional regulator [Nocardioides sp. LHD-245]